MCHRRARSSQCCGLALSHALALHIGLTSLRLSPLDTIVQEKLLSNMQARDNYNNGIEYN